MKGEFAKSSTPAKRKRRPPILPIVGLIVGLGLLATPVIFDIAETWQNNQAITSMTDTVNAQDDEALQEVLDQARAYNANLAGEMTAESTCRSARRSKNVGFGCHVAGAGPPCMASRFMTPPP